jgi:hypothetical protein
MMGPELMATDVVRRPCVCVYSLIEFKYGWKNKVFAVCDLNSAMLDCDVITVAPIAVFDHMITVLILVRPEDDLFWKLVLLINLLQVEHLA